MTTAAVLVFKNQGAAYHALHLAGLQAELEVLEIIPQGPKAQLLVKGPHDPLKIFIQQLSFAELDSTNLISNWDLRIEKAFYSLEHAAPQGALVFIEGASLGGLFLRAQDCLQQGYAIVDLKIPRGGVPWGLLIVTAPQIPDEFVNRTQAHGFQVTRISQPSTALRSYFDIEV